MEQRRDLRFARDQAVVLTLLRDQDTQVFARVTDVAARGLGLLSPVAIEPGTALKIEMEDALVLGEAVYCRREADKWFLGVELNQVLAGLAELGRSLEEFSAPLRRQRLYSVEYGHK
jgi:hypothetical protein